MDVKRIAKILEEKNDLKIREIILNKAQKENQIIHGSRAFNRQSPPYLRKKTSDYDILTKKPKKYAKQIAEELKRRLNKDIKVVKGKHKGTYKVKLGEETIVDYTQLKKSPKVKTSFGNKFRDIKSIKRNAQRLIKKPSAEFRREKDLDTLSRIKKIEELEKRFSF